MSNEQTTLSIYTYERNTGNTHRNMTFHIVNDTHIHEGVVYFVEYPYTECDTDHCQYVFGNIAKAEGAQNTEQRMKKENNNNNVHSSSGSSNSSTAPTQHIERTETPQLCSWFYSISVWFGQAIVLYTDSNFVRFSHFSGKISAYWCDFQGNFVFCSR